MMVNCLATMTRLRTFELGFSSPQSHPTRASRGPLPSTRTVLPALTHFWFRGVSEYLEDLVAQIHTPLLVQTKIQFFNQLIFDVSQLSRFVGGVENYKAINRAYVTFLSHSVEVIFASKRGTADDLMLKLGVSCRESDWQLSSLAQICSSSLPFLPPVKELIIYEDRSSPPRWKDKTDRTPWVELLHLPPLFPLKQLIVYEDRFPPPYWREKTENTQWLEFLQLFASVSDLYISEELARHIAPAVQELVRDRVPDVLPGLRSLFLEEAEPSGLVKEAVEQFLAMRRFSGQPVNVRKWEGGC
ncbi:hypothetical protein BC826DRAFT_1025567, partial [Russula brevipes]